MLMIAAKHGASRRDWQIVALEENGRTYNYFFRPVHRSHDICGKEVVCALVMVGVASKPTARRVCFQCINRTRNQTSTFHGLSLNFLLVHVAQMLFLLISRRVLMLPLFSTTAGITLSTTFIQSNQAVGIPRQEMTNRLLQGDLHSMCSRGRHRL